jgi:hypothetical protein
MKKILFFLLFLSFGTTVFAQKKFNQSAFNAVFATAEWMYEYDAVASFTYDRLLRQPKAELRHIGKEWFSYKDNNGDWHVYFGKMNASNYELAFQYDLDKNFNVLATVTPADSAVLNNYGRAMSNAQRLFNREDPELKDTRMNWYIRRNDNNQFDIWALPGVQADGKMLYGSQYHYTFDPTGRRMVNAERMPKKLKGFYGNATSDIDLDCRQDVTPPLWAVFFSWTYKKYFKSITIQHKYGNSNPMAMDAKQGLYTWFHADR